MNFYNKIILKHKKLTIFFLILLFTSVFSILNYKNTLTFNEKKIDYDLSLKYINNYISNNGKIDENILNEITISKISKKDSLFKNIFLIIKEKEKINDNVLYSNIMKNYFNTTEINLDIKIKIFIVNDINNKFSLTENEAFEEEYFYLKNKIEVLKYLKKEEAINSKED